MRTAAAAPASSSSSGAAEEKGSPGAADGSIGLGARMGQLSVVEDAQSSLIADDEDASCFGVVRILLVEDELVQRMAIEALFEAANEKNGSSLTFVVTSATNAVEALARVTEDPTGFDLILLDVLLPDTNGYDLLPVLRRVVGGDVAVVMASSNSEMSLVQLCVRRGADAFLVKPLGSEEVRHLWQFIKRLPHGSCRDDVMLTRPASENKRSTDTGASSSTDDASTSGNGTVRQRAGAIQPDDVLVCCGHGPAAAASAASEGIARVRMGSDLSEGVQRRLTGDSAYSGPSSGHPSRSTPRVSGEGAPPPRREELPLGADCTQQ